MKNKTLKDFFEVLEGFEKELELHSETIKYLLKKVEKNEKK